MRSQGLEQRERIAIAAVARRMSNTRKKRGDLGDAHVMVAGKRIAVEIAALKLRVTGENDAAKPGLRFDKVATRLLEGVRAALGESVPDGTTVLLAVTAPIRFPSKTATSLENKIQMLLGRRSPDRGEKDTIYGNRVQIRLWRDGFERAPKLIGFVHNSDSDPLLLLNMARQFLELISVKNRRRGAKLAGDRWLVVSSDAGVSFLQAYRHIYSQLRMATDFKKTAIVLGDGSVALL